MKKQVLFIVLMLMPLMVSAQTKINGIYYWLNSKDKVASVTCLYEDNEPGNADCGVHPVSSYSGEIIIPQSVYYNGVTYTVTSIGCNAFYSCEGLTSVVVPNSVKTIAGESEYIDIYNPQYGAFSNCTDLISINIPNSITYIGSDAFKGCNGLKKITFNCKRIGQWFANMNSVQEVIIGEEVTSIDDNAFFGCSGLTSVIINDITAWCKIDFDNIYSNPLFYAKHLYLGGEELKDLVFPDEVTSICNYAFYNGSSLTSVKLPSSITIIGNDAFKNCSSLKSVKIDDLTSWCKIDFSNCYSNPLSFAKHLCINEEELKGLVIPKGVKSIGNYTFFNGSSLSSVMLSDNIISIGSKAFANCPEIKEVYCYAKDVPTISNDTFENSYYIKWATLYVPESSVDLYKASAWSQFGNIVGITGGNEGERCEKPVITLLANGKIKVESATEGATCVTNITASNVEPLSDGEISLNTPLTVYTVTSYATKEGYNDSEIATATFRYEKAEGDMNGDGMLNITDVIHLVNMILGQ